MDEAASLVLPNVWQTKTWLGMLLGGSASPGPRRQPRRVLTSTSSEQDQQDRVFNSRAADEDVSPSSTAEECLNLADDPEAPGGYHLDGCVCREGLAVFNHTAESTSTHHASSSNLQLPEEMAQEQAASLSCVACDAAGGATGARTWAVDRAAMTQTLTAGGVGTSYGQCLCAPDQLPVEYSYSTLREQGDAVAGAGAGQLKLEKVFPDGVPETCQPADRAKRLQTCGLARSWMLVRPTVSQVEVLSDRATAAGGAFVLTDSGGDGTFVADLLDRAATGAPQTAAASTISSTGYWECERYAQQFGREITSEVDSSDVESMRTSVGPATLCQCPEGFYDAQSLVQNSTALTELAAVVDEALFAHLGNVTPTSTAPQSERSALLQLQQARTAVGATANFYDDSVLLVRKSVDDNPMLSMVASANTSCWSRVWTQEAGAAATFLQSQIDSYQIPDGCECKNTFYRDLQSSRCVACPANMVTWTSIDAQPAQLEKTGSFEMPPPLPGSGMVPGTSGSSATPYDGTSGSFAAFVGAAAATRPEYPFATSVHDCRCLAFTNHYLEQARRSAANNMKGACTPCPPNSAEQAAYRRESTSVNDCTCPDDYLEARDPDTGVLLSCRKPNKCMIGSYVEARTGADVESLHAGTCGFEAKTMAHGATCSLRCLYPREAEDPTNVFQTISLRVTCTDGVLDGPSLNVKCSKTARSVPVAIFFTVLSLASLTAAFMVRQRNTHLVLVQMRGNRDEGSGRKGGKGNLTNPSWLGRDGAASGLALGRGRSGGGPPGPGGTTSREKISKLFLKNELR
eukprot:g17083.t1